MCKVKILIWVWVLILVLLGSFVKMKIISAIRVSIPKSERGKSQLLRILYHQFQACQRFFIPVWLYSSILSTPTIGAIRHVSNLCQIVKSVPQTHWSQYFQRFHHYIPVTHK